MKIIDLLNKIANREELPDAIKFNDIVYKKADVGEDYYNFTTSKWFFKDVFDASGVNLEVEILEEKKIPEKLEYYDDSIAWVIDDVGQLSDVDKVIIDKLNDVIDYLKNKGNE